MILDTHGAGETIGEMALDDGVRSASVTALEKSKIKGVRVEWDFLNAKHLIAGQAQAPAPATWRWMNRPVRLVDGTTVTLPDTAENQSTYPQSPNQKPGLGFPLCRIVGLICLGSGAVLNAALSRYGGKGSDEQSLLHTMLDTLEQE